MDKKAGGNLPYLFSATGEDLIDLMDEKSKNAIVNELLDAKYFFQLVQPLISSCMLIN